MTLVHFPLEDFFSRLAMNAEGFYFLQTRHEFMSVYNNNPTKLGFFLNEFIERCGLGEVKYSKSPIKNSHTCLIFTSLKARDTIRDLMENDPWFVFCTKSTDSLYFNSASMLEFISKAEDGYYLSSAHEQPRASDSGYETFCWIRRNIHSQVFNHGYKFFFTNRDDEMRFKLRWADVPSE